MLRPADIEDAWMVDARAQITGVKTCDTHDSEFDDLVLQELMPRTPFILFRYGGSLPNEEERGADNRSGINNRRYFLTVGADALRTKKEGQRGVYDMMDDIRERYDGFSLTVGASAIVLSFVNEIPRVGVQGLVVYTQIWQWDEA